MEPSPLMTTAEACEYLRLQKQTLRKLRCTGNGPPFCRIGSALTGRCLYRRDDLDRWLDARRWTSTTEEQAAAEQTAGGQ